jgi:hypothetical protein
VTGSVTDDAYVDRLELEDAAGVHVVEVALDGSFSIEASLDTAATDNTLCLDATDCAGNHGRECFVLSYHADVDFVIGSPRAGRSVDAPAVTVSGRLTRGDGASVTANGQAGSIRNGYFVVPDVALASGWNLVEVEVTSTTPQVARRHMLVARDDVPRALLRISTARGRTSIVGVTPIGTGPMAADASGTLFYRLLDATGEIHRGRIPGSADAVVHFVDGDGNLASDTEIDDVGDLDAIIPDFPGATHVQVLGLGGDVLAEAPL